MHTYLTRVFITILYCARFGLSVILDISAIWQIPIAYMGKYVQHSWVLFKTVVLLKYIVQAEFSFNFV